MSSKVFFYGTLMSGFDRRHRAGLDGRLSFLGRAWTPGQLFDLGLYPGAVPSEDGRIWGEVYETSEPGPVLEALDEIEGFDPVSPDNSLYLRQRVEVRFPEGTAVTAWIYFYNAPLGQALPIPSGDYRELFRART
jgi:gamma-glutamylcyclotransferase (GGCT)/AIG2-like uncharacterized protein YtfP